MKGGEDIGAEQTKLLFEKKKDHNIITYFLDNKEIKNFSLWQKSLLLLKTIFSLKSYKEISALIKIEKPDLAHIHNVLPLISPSIYYALKKMKVPIIQTVHNYRYFCSNGLFLDNKKKICELCGNGNFLHGVIRKCYRNSYLQTSVLSTSLFLHRLLKTFVKNVNIFISPSEFLKNKLIEYGFPKDKIEVINNFINDKDFKPCYDFNYYAVYLGRLSEEKGLFTMLNAFQEISDFNLKIIGEGPLYQDLINFVDRNKLFNVEILGFIRGAERFEILKKAMFMIFPSECYENLPYAIIESFALGTPIIASHIGGLIEQIEEGKNGLLFQPGDIKDLRKKILVLIKNPNLVSSMRHNARKYYEKKFGEEVGYNKLLEIYRRII